MWGETIEDLETQIICLKEWCKRINLKLSTVTFGGMVVSAEKIQNQWIVSIDPSDGRILALTDTKIKFAKGMHWEQKI